MELFGTSFIIAEFPKRLDITGVGLSDWHGYSDLLEKKLGYTNTFFHKPPTLDITRVHADTTDQYDFIISSDVFEHVCPPISTAFENAFRLLKPGGTMIFTVPYVPGETKEHFPGISRFRMKEEQGQWLLDGVTLTGESRQFTGLTFHGGPGTTVECRLFGERSLRRDCLVSGFGHIKIYREAVPEFGIFWPTYDPEKAPYRPLIYGLDTPPWALRKGVDDPLAQSQKP